MKASFSRLIARLQGHRKILIMILLGCIILLAAFLRLYRIEELMRFIWDEGRDMMAIRDIIVNRDLTLFGPFNEIDGNIDFFGVFHYYLMLPALWLAHFNPVGPAIFTAVLGVFSVALSFLWVRQWSTEHTALWVSALLAASPLVVTYQQWPWNPNTIGFFGMVYLLAIERYRRISRFWVATVAGLSLGLLFQLHYFTIPLGLAAVLVFLTQERKRWLDAIGFVGTFILPNLSFVVFDLSHAGFYRKIVWESFVGGGKQQFFELSLLNVVTGPFIHLYEVSTAFFLAPVLGLFAVGCCIYLSWERIRVLPQILKKQATWHSLDFVLYPWIAFLLMTSFFPSLLDEYHSGALWIGIAAVVVVSAQRLLGKYVGLLLAPIVLWMIIGNAFWREPSSMANMPRVRQAAQAVVDDRSDIGTGSFNIASFVDADTRGVRFRYFLEAGGVQPLAIEQYPQSDVIYVVTESSWQETRQNPAWELDAFRNSTQSAELWRGEGWRVYRVERARE